MLIRKLNSALTARDMITNNILGMFEIINIQLKNTHEVGSVIYRFVPTKTLKVEDWEALVHKAYFLLGNDHFHLDGQVDSENTELILLRPQEAPKLDDINLSVDTKLYATARVARTMLTQEQEAVDFISDTLTYKLQTSVDEILKAYLGLDPTEYHLLFKVNY